MKLMMVVVSVGRKVAPAWGVRQARMSKEVCRVAARDLPLVFQALL
jgi:hypothetical protein